MPLSREIPDDPKPHDNNDNNDSDDKTKNTNWGFLGGWLTT
jgi:hypothetical protein